jgi:hypothetical protein
MDSGTSGHVVGDIEKLEYYQESNNSQGVKTADGNSHGIQGFGNATVKTSSWEIKLTNVKNVLGLNKNLISVGSIADIGNLVVFSRTHLDIGQPESKSHYSDRTKKSRKWFIQFREYFRNKRSCLGRQNHTVASPFWAPQLQGSQSPLCKSPSHWPSSY